jgi:hypothetical protein
VRCCPMPCDAVLVLCDAVLVLCDAVLVLCDAVLVLCDAVLVLCDAMGGMYCRHELDVLTQNPRIRSLVDALLRGLEGGWRRVGRRLEEGQKRESTLTNTHNHAHTHTHLHG